MRTTRLHVSTLLCLTLAASIQASDQVPARPQTTPVALRGATIYPVSGPSIEGGTIVFEEGRITALGTRVEIPRNARVFDVPGKRVYPGLINAFTSIGLTEIGSVRGTVDSRETGSINPNVRAEVAVNPASEIIPVTRANGIALALTCPSGGTISGRSALLMLDGWTWEDMVLEAPIALHVNWPRMTATRAWWMQESEEEQKETRRKALAVLDRALDDARAYMVARAAAGEPGVPAHSSDLRWEAMIPVLQKTIPVAVLARDIRQIQAAVAWAGRQDLRLIIVGGDDAWRVAELLAEKDVPVIVTGTHDLPSLSAEGYDDPFALPARLHDAGVEFCISTGISWGDGGDAANARNLPYEAATAAAYGLPAEEALRAVTLYPAQVLGVADRVGSLEVGKDATLIVTDGDPLEVPTQIERMFIRGRDIDLSSRHTMLYEKYLKKYEAPY